MTNNKLTDEFLETLIATGTYALDEGFIRISDDSELMAMARELQEYRKGAGEPVAWLNDAYLGRGMVDGEAGSEDAGPGYIPVYRHPQNAAPAPAVESVPDENGNLPCPFCGGKCDETEWRGTSPDIGSIFGPGCEECGATARNIAEWNHRAAMLPDCWVMVPVEPTEDMVISGFESEPNESFSKPEKWEAYEEMSGCQQAAHRAKLCWSAMVAAAPQQEVKPEAKK